MKKEEVYLVRTSRVLPEEYYVYDKNDNNIGYINMCYGVLKVVDISNYSYPINIYREDFHSMWMNSFYSNREKYLDFAKERICEYWNSRR